MNYPCERLAAQATIDTPMGPMLIAATERGLAGLWFEDQRHHPDVIDARVDAGQRWIALTARQLSEYFEGRRERFEIPLDAAGTEFQQAVWHALSALPFAATTSYGAIAQTIGKPAAVRAVGAAVGRNPIGIIVPCHRVLGRDGSLTGYAGGLDRKTALLAHEARHSPTALERAA
ncbi:methylated-DNA--[protein]-cysteine S-methyltransferase [Rivibacter subsaxonicus]|uniref:Methylated-DNA--protein-cysteine methyltransferase n=1 Tax=Rivibacter subsaxonicus TaxID=457575 RepID=A0A4Q7W292_9BURK|nr:methylated-DNA--[protein]-cysteine S-methyltransferase [Rivibacter subsaxonicus]RZU03045.1 methylated-DNA-[protein]-cysteine S-methyltransferase [Rivibacter subsaxonicus]